MGDNDFGRGKHTHTPSAALEGHLATVQRSKTIIESNRRKANFKQQREQMAADKAKNQSKSAGQRSPDQLCDKLEADEERRRYLIKRITQHDSDCDVMFEDLDDLEDIWKEMKRKDAAATLKNPGVQTLGTVNIDLATHSKKAKALKAPTSKHTPSGQDSRSSKQDTVSQSSGAKPCEKSQSASKKSAPAVSSSSRRPASDMANKGLRSPNTRYEVIDLDAPSDPGEKSSSGDSGAESDVPTKKQKRGKKSRKATKDYEDPMEQRLINVACEHLFAKAIKLGLCLSPPEFDTLVRECWGDAKAELAVCTNKYPCTTINCETMKTQFNSYRSHIRKHTSTSVPMIYGFHSKGLQECAKCAGDILTKGFHIDHLHSFAQQPEAKTGGKYQHPIILNPPAQRYPHFFKAMPLETIAFVCSVVQFTLEQIQLCKLKMDNMEFKVLRERYLMHLASLQTFEKTKPGRVNVIRTTLWSAMVALDGRTATESDMLATVENALTEYDFDDEVEPTEEELALINPPSRNTVHADEHRAKGPSIDTDENDREVFYTGSGSGTKNAPLWSPLPVRLSGEESNDGESDDGKSKPKAKTKPKAKPKPKPKPVAVPAAKLCAPAKSDEDSSITDSNKSGSSGSNASERRKLRTTMRTAKKPHEDVDMPDVSHNAAVRPLEGGGGAEVEAASSPAKAASSPAKGQSKHGKKATLKSEEEDPEDQEPQAKKQVKKRKHVADSDELDSELDQQDAVGGDKSNGAKNRRTKMKVVEYESDATGGKRGDKGKATDKGKGVDRGPVEPKGKEVTDGERVARKPAKAVEVVIDMPCRTPRTRKAPSRFTN
ncbi:hypothetical protein FRC10_003483, partial [Ceratobasidium sp. 414]